MREYESYSEPDFVADKNFLVASVCSPSSHTAFRCALTILSLPGYSSSVADADMKKVRQLFDINVIGHYAVTRAFIPLLIAAKDACIVNIASLAAVVPFPFNSVYASTKGALISFGDTIRLELAPFGYA